MTGWDGRCIHPDGCECGPGGEKALAARAGWCNTHRMRISRTGEPGPPGLISGSHHGWRGQREERAALRFLDLVPEDGPRRARIARGRRGSIQATWAGGWRSRLPACSVEAWRRRGWLSLGPPSPEDGTQELTIAPDAYRKIAATLERRRKAVRMLEDPGSVRHEREDEASPG